MVILNKLFFMKFYFFLCKVCKGSLSLYALLCCVVCEMFTLFLTWMSWTKALMDYGSSLNHRKRFWILPQMSGQINLWIMIYERNWSNFWGWIWRCCSKNPKSLFEGFKGNLLSDKIVFKCCLVQFISTHVQHCDWRLTNNLLK